MTTTMSIAAATPLDGLPRADALTDALLGRDTSGVPGEPVTAAGIRAIRTRVGRGLTALQQDSPSAPGMLRVGHYQVACALAEVGAGDSIRATGRAASRRGTRHSGTVGGYERTPFRWTARAARRSVGLAALRAGLDGRAATPADAVGIVLSDPGGPAGVGRAGPGSCADWICTLPHAARTLVAAEAASWTTTLWTALDWGQLDPHRPVVGGPDKWWRWTGSGPEPHSASGPLRRRTPRLAVRGRADIRLDPGDGPAPLGGTHVLVLDGQPGTGTRHALLLSALVEALSSPRSPKVHQVASRVVGWWPDCGKAWVVRVDDRTLSIAADALVETVASMLGAAVQGG